MFALVTLAAAVSAPPTFSKDVAPLLWKNCASCHRPGEVGPFPLLTYKDAAKRADFLAEITASKRMPPWKAEPGYGSFHDARTLTSAEIDTLAAWAKAGAPEGDPQDLPPAPKFPDGWQLGEPDLVLTMPEPFTVRAGGRDVQQCFVIPVPIDADKTVSAVEFRPGNRKVVHHAILYLDGTGAARKKDEAEKGPGYSSFGGPGILPTGGLGAWVPGQTPRHLPDGVGRLLRKGADLVLQIHYHPSGKEEVDRSSVGVYFAKKPVSKYVAAIGLRNRDIDIPAGEKNFRREARSEPLPVDAYAIAIGPHMHNLGREMKVYARTPAGTEIPLIWIKDWDFNWQGSYHFSAPVKLPKGSVLKMEARYDNSADNPRNPSDPPKRVRWGEQTTDEMCLCGVQVITDTTADLRQIMAMRGNRLGLILGGGEAPGVSAAGDKAFQGEIEDMLAKQGVPIPERAAALLKRYDKDGDGRLTKDEIDAMPALLRDRVKQAIAERVQELTGKRGDGKKKED
jgi:hypothetical protein